MDIFAVRALKEKLVAAMKYGGQADWPISPYDTMSTSLFVKAVPVLLEELNQQEKEIDELRAELKVARDQLKLVSQTLKHEGESRIDQTTCLYRLKRILGFP